MRGSLQDHAPLASNPPDADTAIAAASRAPAFLDQPPSGSSDRSLKPLGAVRKRSYSTHKTPQESPTKQPVTGTPPSADSDSDEDEQSPQSKRKRPSPKDHGTPGVSPRAYGSKRKERRFKRASPMLTTSHNESKSRFLEGSMRDRESQRPPNHYLRMDGETEDEQELLSAEPNSERPRSGVFRFGRALANAFNPTTVWHGMFGREKSSSVSPTKSEANDDRKAKAEKAYAELKRRSDREMGLPSAASSVRDSGVDLDSGRVSEERKRDGIVFYSSTTTPATETFPVSVSPPSNEGHKARRRSSITNLHKMKSHFSLKNLRREAASPPQNMAGSASMQHRVKKKASKKDLSRQKKLTKRISNLESQLERARRELAESLGAPEVPVVPVVYQQELGSNVGIADDSLISEMTPRKSADEGEEHEDDPNDSQVESVVESPPASVEISAYVRPRFVPGALPSLPSERLLLAPNRALPAAPTEDISGSPKKLDRVIERAADTVVESTEQPSQSDVVPPKRLVRKSSIPRATQTPRGMTESVSSWPRKTTVEDVDPVKRLSQPCESTMSPKYQFVDSSDSASGSDSEAAPSSHQESQFQTRGRKMVHRGSVARDANALSLHHENASTANLASMANITDGSTSKDLTADISATDLRGLYAASSAAQSRRLRAMGPNSPQRRTNGSKIATDAATQRSVLRKRSVSPRQTRSMAKGSPSLKGRKKKTAPVTATPGSGDGRGEIIPPLPKGAAEKSPKKGRLRGLMNDAKWEGWGDDVF